MRTTASSAVWVSRSNGQLLAHSNHLGTHLDGEIHFFTPGKDIASLDLNEFLTGPAAVVDSTTPRVTTSLEERFTGDKYQLMHIEMFPHHIIHAECVGGDIDLLCNRRTTIGFFPWRFVDGESCIGRCVAMVDEDDYEEMMARKAAWPKTRFGDGYNPEHVESIQRLTRRF